jgi:hypothetical protein
VAGIRRPKSRGNYILQFPTSRCLKSPFQGSELFQCCLLSFICGLDDLTFQPSRNKPLSNTCNRPQSINRSTALLLLTTEWVLFYWWTHEVIWLTAQIAYLFSLSVERVSVTLTSTYSPRDFGRIPACWKLKTVWPPGIAGSGVRYEFKMQCVCFNGQTLNDL